MDTINLDTTSAANVNDSAGNRFAFTSTGGTFLQELYIERSAGGTTTTLLDQITQDRDTLFVGLGGPSDADTLVDPVQVSRAGEDPFVDVDIF